MKQFKTILKFELDNYFKSKGYMISTILIALIAIVIMFIPRITKSSSDDDSNPSGESNNEANVSEDDLTKIAIYDMTGIFDSDMYREMFPDNLPVMKSSAEEVKNAVDGIDAEAKFGFVIKSSTSYDSYVYNKETFDTTSEQFEEYMKYLIKLEYCQAHDLDINEFMEMDYREIEGNEIILGKDAGMGYAYCYVLVIVVFMLIIMYGVQIASGVTNEKSNRSIEILVTSTSSTAILFGKVFAGAIASVFQVACILGGTVASYKFNQEYWDNGIVDMFLNIPNDVLLTFAIFGIGGFLFYAFMYGALGALVSKIEDLNKTSGIAQMLVMIVYFVVLINLSDIDGMAIKICSYLPISSYSAMFARVGMGEVSTIEIVISAIVLYASVVVMGIIGGKIFRSSTLRYGNPIKLKNAFKQIKNDK